MSRRTLEVSDALYDYLMSVSLRETDVQRRLREQTAELPYAAMQVAPEQAQFMALLVELIGARKAIEIGTFTGYSALAVAQALPSDGRLIACDISDQYTAIGRPFWAEANVAERIDLRLAPALETLDRLIREGQGETFDFAFIDADKPTYPAYFERCLTLVRPGGLIAIDNVLWGGSVIDPRKDDDDNTIAIRDFNAALFGDERVSISLVPIGDGLTLARKR